ncbi:SLAP domain-containing protein [Lacticaseibacillus zhaodongensis]|uniref:SLAP domain-containing protein n=1 Tax=Lacticaseibacillus zhaodongensis TaxID=2668065 RepID=UPI0012D31818|nr:SLAP domain-containing protein [Lacticaseibacillus zhaodongensis]
MKKTSLLISAALLGAGVASVPAISNSVYAAAQAVTEQTTQQSGTVSILPGKGVPVYTTPGAKDPIYGKSLSAGSNWKYFSTAEVNGALWFNLGGNQWISAAGTESTLTNTAAGTTSTSTKATSSTTTATTKASSTTTPAKTTTSNEIVQTGGTIGILMGHDTQVYSAPDGRKPIAGKTLKGGTTWKFFTEQPGGGLIWFNLGGNQWINDGDIDGMNINRNTTSTAKTTTSAKSTSSSFKATAVSGSIKVNYVPGYGIAIWTSPVSGQPVPGKKLMHGTNWKVFQETTVNGHTYYNLGGAQWIDAHYVIANLKGKETAFSGKITTGKKRINVYADVNGNKVTRTIGANVKLNAYGKINNGQLWYRIGPKEYVRAIDLK